MNVESLLRNLIALRAAVIYAKANVDDLNDTFADFSEGEENLTGKIRLGDVSIDSFDESDFEELLLMFPR